MQNNSEITENSMVVPQKNVLDHRTSVWYTIPLLGIHMKGLSVVSWTDNVTLCLDISSNPLPQVVPTTSAALGVGSILINYLIKVCLQFQEL